jgi:hypothetical protein
MITPKFLTLLEYGIDGAANLDRRKNWAVVSMNLQSLCILRVQAQTQSVFGWPIETDARSEFI